MDNTNLIVPAFNGTLNLSTAALCDFALIAAEADVQVTKIIITADGIKHKIPVGPGKYKMALFLLYCAVLKENTSFSFDAALKEMLRPCFGGDLVDDAHRPETTHATLGLLATGTDIRVSLVLRSGYELPKNPGRTVRKLIQHAWDQHERFNQDTPVPLIRQALKEFWRAERSGKIRIIHSWDPEIWPSNVWHDRAWELCRVLGVK